MNRSVRFYLIAIAALLAVCAFVVPSYADTQGVSPSNCASTSFCDGYAFQATLTPITPSSANGNSNYSLSYSITNVGGPAAHPQSWSLTLFGNQYDIGSTFSDFTMTLDGKAFSSTSLYTVKIGKSDNSVGGGGCNSHISGGVCVIGIGVLPTLSTAGDNLTFNFDFTCSGCTELANWIFLSEGTNVNGGGNAYAISQTQAVPEPSTPILLICSLLAALGMLAIPRVRSILRAQQSGLHSLKRI